MKTPEELQESTRYIAEIYTKIYNLFGELNIPSWLVSTLTVISALIGIAIICFIGYFIARFIFVTTLTIVAKRTRTTWDDKVLNRRVAHRLSHLAPAILLYTFSAAVLPESMQGFITFLQVLAELYMLLAVILTANALLNSIHDIYLDLPVAKNKPIKAYVQLIQIVLFFIGGLILVSILIRKNPWQLMLGLGAMAAVILLIFKDTILGLVASVQASANNMVKPGDWIVMNSRGTNGTVLEITLNTVKVQNWDRTISTFPTYALVSESFQNWKGMEESNGRRIKRSIFIDARTVKFCTTEELERYKRIGVLREYIEKTEREIEDFNRKENVDLDVMVNGRHQTNIGVFRMYVNFYLKSHPYIQQIDATLMSRLLEPTPQGIPLEIYCFSKIKDWVAYEMVQSNIFDHLFAVINEFGLQVFQQFSGSDIHKSNINLGVEMREEKRP